MQIVWTIIIGTIMIAMKMIDALIKSEVAYYRGIYEEQGLRGILDMVLQ